MAAARQHQHRRTITAEEVSWKGQLRHRQCTVIHSHLAHQLDRVSSNIVPDRQDLVQRLIMEKYTPHTCRLLVLMYIYVVVVCIVLIMIMVLLFVLLIIIIHMGESTKRLKEDGGEEECWAAVVVVVVGGGYTMIQLRLMKRIYMLYRNGRTANSCINTIDHLINCGDIKWQSTYLSSWPRRTINKSAVVAVMQWSPSWGQGSVSVPKCLRWPFAWIWIDFVVGDGLDLDALDEVVWPWSLFYVRICRWFARVG